MKRWAYTGLFHLAIPAVCLKLLWRARKQPAYGERIAERFGYYSSSASHTANRASSAPLLADSKTIWLHTVSVGEFLASVPLIEQLLSEGINLVVTTTTPTGSEQVQKLLSNRVQHVYVPYDIPQAIHRFLDAFKPSLLLIMETELWPNIIRICQHKNIPSVLINGRLSARSARGYQRLGNLSQEMFAGLTKALMQYPADAERIRALGVTPERVEVCGSIKFDVTLTEQQIDQAHALRQGVAHQHVWIAASTHPGEEQIILQAHQRLRKQYPSSLLILAPRHPERAPEVSTLCADFTTVTRSSGDPVEENTEVLLLDTLGELLVFYGVADVALVGGSLVERGGHNLVEPALWAKPVLSGPHLFNFAAIAEQMQACDALSVVDSSDDLQAALQRLFGDSARAQQVGFNANQFAQNNQGALSRVFTAIKTLYSQR